MFLQTFLSPKQFSNFTHFLQCLKKIAPENIKKTPSKVVHNRPFFQYWPGCPNGPFEIPTTKSPVMQDWVCMYVCFPLLILRSEMFPSQRRYHLTTICPRDTYGSHLGLTWLSPKNNLILPQML